MTSPYADAADAYLTGGWSPIPLPFKQKDPPPTGWTGYLGARVTDDDVERWSTGKRNVALRLPETVLGIDVDNYDDKTGGASLQAAEDRLGPLPSTWRSTSRDDDPISGIKFYRVPPGRQWADKIGPGIEVIHHGHRYAVAAPSLHPEGRVYGWFDPDGLPAFDTPEVTSFPELPPAWVAEFDQGDVADRPVKADLKESDVGEWLTSLPDGPPCREISGVLVEAERALAGKDARHNVGRNHLLKLVRLGEQGHAGALAALDTLESMWLAALTHRSAGVGEFERMVTGAVAMVLGDPSTEQRGCCSTPEDDFDPVEREPDTTGERFKAGGAFILDVPTEVPSIWGDGDQSLWPEGEALLIAGHIGVGKTTLAGQVVRGRIGLTCRVLGFTVKPTQGHVLYLAMDRPRQVARALRRQFQDVDREVLNAHLVFWVGPPLKDLARHPDELLRICRLARADTVVLDSLKDAAIGLSDDEVGAGYNRARQICLANGVEVLELHHMVKHTATGGTPTSLEDLYGSVWIAAGAGSVILLSGKPGDPIVDLRHLKQPAGEVGPFKIVHDHETGTSRVYHAADLLVMASAKGGVTAKAAASVLYDTAKPTASEIMKARRKLEKLAEAGRLDFTAGDRGANPTPSVWTYTGPITDGFE